MTGGKFIFYHLFFRSSRLSVREGVLLPSSLGVDLAECGRGVDTGVEDGVLRLRWGV